MRVATVPAVVRALSAFVPGESTVRAEDKSSEAIKAPEKVKKGLGEDTVAILAEATKVEVFRLKAQPVPKDTAPTIGSDKLQWVITATGKEPRKDFAAKVRAFLFDEATEPEPFDEKRFSFGPGADVAFRFWKGKESATVVVDFDRWTFLVVTRDAEGKQINITIGELLAYNREKRDIEKGDLFARAKALAVEAFPDDETIKAIRVRKPLVRPPVGDKVPAHLLTMLEKAEQFDLLSLDPQRPEEKPADDFHGWKVLGKTAVKEAEGRAKLVAALKKGVEDNDGAAAGCFRPRHGIRVTCDGKTADFVICFECFYVQVVVGGKREDGFRTTGSPQDAFNGVLKEANVPLPGK